jgi:uncharacterized protein
VTTAASLLGADGQAVPIHCRIADSFCARARGLLGRRELPRGEALLIQPTSSVHTIGMRFAIDVAYLSRELTVLEIAHRLRPWRISVARRANSALELAAGECERLGIEVGDRLVWGAE